MIVKPITLKEFKEKALVIGFVAENLRTQVRINCAEIIAEYPSAVPTLAIKSPIGQIYPSEVTKDGDEIVWNVRDCDLAHRGAGEMQLTFTQNEVVAKTVVGSFIVSKSIVVNGAPPDPIQDWLTRADAALDAIPITIELALAQAKASGEFDGYSPTIVVEDITGGHRVTITDVNGPHAYDVMDGKDGEDGFSPSASVTKDGSVVTITITDKSGTTSEQVTDGDPSDLIDDEHESQNSTFSSAKIDSDLSAVDNRHILLEDNIIGTTQSVEYDQQTGNVSRIVHMNGNTTVRTDVFTFGQTTITEVRTLYDGESVTIVTNLETLVTTVTYANAP